MKVALLFLCACGIASAAFVGPNLDRASVHLRLMKDVDNLSLIEDALSRLKDVLSRLSQVALDAINDFKGRVDQLVEDAVKKAEELFQLANQSIGDYLAEAKQNLTEYQNVVTDCLAPVPAELEQIARDSAANAKQCSADFKTRVGIARDNVKEHVEFFVGKVEEILAMADKCLAENSGLVEKVKCLLGHLNDAAAIVMEIVTDTGKLLAETTQEVVSLANDTRDCYLDVVRLSKHEVDKVVSRVKECIKQENGEQL